MVDKNWLQRVVAQEQVIVTSSMSEGEGFLERITGSSRDGKLLLVGVDMYFSRQTGYAVTPEGIPISSPTPAFLREATSARISALKFRKAKIKSWRTKMTVFDVNFEDAKLSQENSILSVMKAQEVLLKAGWVCESFLGSQLWRNSEGYSHTLIYALQDLERKEQGKTLISFQFEKKLYEIAEKDAYGIILLPEGVFIIGDVVEVSPSTLLNIRIVTENSVGISVRGLLNAKPAKFLGEKDYRVLPTCSTS